MPRSMTGFARAEQQAPWGTMTCELRSVNHRFLEPNLRLPDNLRALETTFRAELKKHLNRGKVDVFISCEHEQGASQNLALDHALATNIRTLAETIGAKLENSAAINPIDILRWPGVIARPEIDRDALEGAALSSFDEALSALMDHREREGGELKRLIEARLDDIAEHVVYLRENMPDILQRHRQKLTEKLAALNVELDEDRLAQESVLVAQKADVAEELDRLDTHLREVRLTLDQAVPIGRRLDFLMQELNREANTLSSKSMSSKTTQRAVDIKVLIEQMREQIQNLE